MLDDLVEDDDVLMRFPGRREETKCRVATVRFDIDTGERLYDIEANHEEKSALAAEGIKDYVKWVKRNLVRRKPKSHDEVQREGEETLWSAQVRAVS